MSRLEFRLDLESVLPLLEHVRPLMEELSNELASLNSPPEDDELISEFWSTDLLNSQRKDLAAIAALFDDDFLESGRAAIDEEDADLILRGCAAIRLKLRQSALGEISDEILETGDFEIEELSHEQRLGYASYALFASLQELIISQLEL